MPSQPKPQHQEWFCEMIRQLPIGSGLTLLSIAIHVGFIASAVWEIRRHEAWLRRPPLPPKLAGSLCVVSFWLIVSMSVTVFAWALYFLWADAAPPLRRAISGPCVREERCTDIRGRESPIRNLGHAEVGVVRARAQEARRHSQISRVLRREIAGCGNKDLAFA